MRNSSTLARRSAIQRLVSSAPVGTQDELRRLLEREGFTTTQGTLSRDLARLGALRVSRPEGGSVYELDGSPPGVKPAIGGLAEMLRGVAHNGSLVVVHTRPGAAPAVARAIDEARLRPVLGTIAGDDTVFVATAHRATPASVAAMLRELFGIGGRR